MARDGLAEIEVAQLCLDMVRSELAELARLLVKAILIRPANHTLVEQALAELRVPSLPPGLTPHTAQRLATLAAPARITSQIYEVVIPNAEPLLLALIPDNERIAPIHVYRRR